MELHNIEKESADRRRFVLIADGNKRNQVFLSVLLKEFGYETCAVSTAGAALKTAVLMRPVLAITARQVDDDHDALGLIRLFKSADLEPPVPIVVLVAKPDPAFEQECLRAGALTCLRAPVTFESFYRVVQVAIEPLPRMTIRISANVPAAIDGKRGDERVQEISENGALVLTSSPYQRDRKLAVTIFLPDGEVSVDAVVLYVKRSDQEGSGKNSVGLQFTRISEEDQQQIRLFIRREISKGIAPLRPPA